MTNDPSSDLPRPRQRAACALSRDGLAQLIDHTLLKPESTAADVADLAAEAGELGTYSIVSPLHLPVDVPAGVHVATVVGFPSGAVKAEIKAAEAARAVADGAEEVDMVINIAGGGRALRRADQRDRRCARRGSGAGCAEGDH